MTGTTVIYFAHSLRDYGTQVAAAAKQVIAEAYPGTPILDPEDLDWAALVKQLGSYAAVYANVVKRSTQLAVLEHGGFVGRGIYEEVIRAIATRKPIEVIRRGRLWPLASITTVNINDWKLRYAQLRVDANNVDVYALGSNESHP